MGLFNRTPYMGGMGAPMGRGRGLRGFLLVLAIAFGLYFLNLAFLWVKIPSIAAGVGKYINIFTGFLLILLGLMTVIRPRYY